MNTIYDLIIIGGGPAGVAAGVYAARKELKTLFITKDFESQSIVSPKIENWIGTVAISGAELAQNLQKHLEAYQGENLQIISGQKVSNLEKKDDLFQVTTENQETHQSKTILISTGSQRRKLNVPGADRLEHKGLTYCATCDGPLYRNKDIVVIGGGNAGFESAAQLAAYVNSVTILHRGPEFKADEITIKKVLNNPKVKALTNIETLEVKGENTVEAIIYQNQDSQKTELKTQGIFVEIGAIPNTEFAKNLVATNSFGAIIIDPKNQQSQTLGVWAAGDCTDALYHQNNIAVGDGVKALEDIYNFLHTK
ncbi:FAD-dependent oxidoreductase [Candidatus Nomurabacteria bacterium]|nr:FAD-dependent oxidoreductase [Candidatus Nomurabacteria bacterium]